VLPSLAHWQLMLTQFPLDQSPLLVQNCPMVAAKPKSKLQNGEEYLMVGYGVLRLYYVSETRELGWDWVVFFGEEGNTRKVIVMVPKLWDRQPDDSRFSVFLYNFSCFVYKIYVNISFLFFSLISLSSYSSFSLIILEHYRIE
jgi:hypothetical protein